MKLSSKALAALKRAERVALSVKADEAGHWVTTSQGNRLFIGEDGNARTGPGGEPVSSGSSADVPSYAGYKSGTKSLKITPSGSVKLSKPKDATDALKQLNALSDLAKMADSEFTETRQLPKNDRHRVMADLRRSHVMQQLQRGMGYAKMLAGKKTAEDELGSLVDKLSKKWNVKPVDPEKTPEPEL